MLYVEVKKSLDAVIQFLDVNSIEVPKDIREISGVFHRCIDTGEQVSEEKLSLIKRWLFPDVGMGWFEELKYEMSEEKYRKLCSLTSELSKVMKET